MSVAKREDMTTITATDQSRSWLRWVQGQIVAWWNRVPAKLPISFSRPVVPSDRNTLHSQSAGGTEVSPQVSDARPQSASGERDSLSCATVDVYNFDHGVSSPWSFCIGPHRFHVRPEHLDREILAYSGGHIFSHRVIENEISPEVTPRDARPGAWRPTAVLEVTPALRGASPMLPDVPGRTVQDDLALVLSFLTGREVTIGNDAVQSDWLRSGEPIVVGSFFYHPCIDWSVLPSLASSGGADAMYVLTLAMSAPHLMTKFALGSAALDRLSGTWWGKSGASIYDDGARNKVASVRPGLEDALLGAGLSAVLAADIAPRLTNLCNDSAVAKLRAFLAAHDMFPRNADATAESRLVLLNKHRNAVLHRATIHVIKEASFEQNSQIAVAVAILVLMISRVYVAAHLLKIKDDTYGIESARETVRTFFITGRFRDHDVFGESYADYLSRLHDAWLRMGDFPG